MSVKGKAEEPHTQTETSSRLPLLVEERIKKMAPVRTALGQFLSDLGAAVRAKAEAEAEAKKKEIEAKGAFIWRMRE